MLDRHSKKDFKELNRIYAKAALLAKQGMLAEAARSYRFFLSQWPEPVAYYNHGVVLKRMKSYDEAILNYEKAIALKPDYAEAHVNIGSIHCERGEFDAALAQFGKAIHYAPLMAEAYYNRGVVLQELRRHQEALADYDETLALQPRYYLAYLNKSVILYELKRKAEAARNYEQLLKADPDHIDARWNLGILKLSEGDYANGWKLSEARLKLHSHHYNDGPQKPYWDGREDPAGKTVFLRWEQGFGDTIQFCRFALLLKQMGAKIILSVQEPLKRLAASLDDDITVLGEDEVPERYDYHALLMSLPHAFKTSVDTVPYPKKYLRVEAGEISYWGERMAHLSGLKLGLVWAGGHRPDITCARRNDANRSMSLSQFLPLLGMSGTCFFSLQKGPPAAQLEAVRTSHELHDWTDGLADFAATGALIENLDLVITVDTAVAHLAASLGKPVWILVPFVSCWRWLEGRTESPWYDSVRLFRQSERGNWDEVIDAVQRELRKLAG